MKRYGPDVGWAIGERWAAGGKERNQRERAQGKGEDFIKPHERENTK
jgi:hypothetical protein